ncbi:sodium/glutamate symporter [Microcella alkaliphila]|uniref:Sodium/glutamate symporter n=1 Tax=Microcella alkaliphila TaxID=279828 RepID=A0A0U4X081_9MICO|nr:sodium/glutamate symporter [Microcella alkaliphila]BAU33338.1 sodium/glutamate symporter [Microcella alkaliphila]
MSFDLSDAQWAGFSIVVLGIVLLLATVVRRYVPLFASLFIPTSVIAGFVILLIGPQILGVWTDTDGAIPGEVLAIWATLPGLLINVVFAAVMLGNKLPKPAQIWRASAPHVIFGSALSFGQFALGALAVALILTPFFGVTDLAGSIIEMSFAGGHGTIAGMGPLLAEAGASDLIDLGLGLATISMVTGIVFGSLLVRWAVRNPRIQLARTTPLTGKEVHDLNNAGVDPSERDAEPDNRGMGPVTVALMCIALAIAAAIGTMSLATLGANVPVLIVFTVIAVAWSVTALLFFGPRIHGRDWFEHAIADFGQSQGNVATGFVLADMVDPQRRTNAANAYGYKQLGYEPFLGGGLITAFSVPLIIAWGSLTFGLVSLGLAVGFLAWGVGRRRALDRASARASATDAARS